MKSWICGALAMAAVANASAFALLGPIDGEDWQVLDIGYQFGTDVASPRNIGEEYRWNTPIVYYAYDQSFVDYFGTNGTAAIDQGMAIFNALSNVSVYSSALTEFPLIPGEVNPSAAALGLLDLKSYAMRAVIEELGLGNPVRWTWTLRAREENDDFDCPTNWQYSVVMRNYDIQTGTYSAFVNGNLNSYTIVEWCEDPPPPGWLANAIEIPGAGSAVSIGAGVGVYFTSLTRDDVGGLRYLFRTNNVNIEGIVPDAVVISSTSTNFADQQVVITSDLASLIQAGSTNTAAQLQALFPGLVVTSTTLSFQQVVSSNIVVEFVNEPFDPAGYPPRLRPTVVYTTNFAQLYTHTFGNVVTNSYFPTTRVTTVTTNFGVTTCPPLTPAGTICFGGGSVSSPSSQPFPSGDYFLLPTNNCGYQIVSNLLTTVVPVTNSSTLVVDGFGQVFFQASIRYFTNHYYLVNFYPCGLGVGGTNASLAFRQGMNKITFVRVDNSNFDSVLGVFYTPIVTNYNMVAVVNNVPVVETYRRTVTEPDFLFAAADIAGPPDDVGNFTFSRSDPNFINNSVGALAGPGTIEPAPLITFNKVGPMRLNIGPDFLDEMSSFTAVNVVFGSFDGSTNAPVVYPEGTSIEDLENSVLINITPNVLEAPVNVAYSQQLLVVGGEPPFTFSLAPGSQLPPGLELSSEGLISGTPTVLGTYDFTVQLIDGANRQVEEQITLTVN